MENLDAVRSQIVNDIAGGIDDPTWYGPDSSLDEAGQDTSYAGELVGARLPYLRLSHGNQAELGQPHSSSVALQATIGWHR